MPAVTAFVADPSTEELYDPALLYRVIEKGEATAVEHYRFGIQLFHEFSRGVDGVTAHFADQIAIPKQRTAHLVGRFFELAKFDGRILFVRNAVRKDVRNGAAWATQVDDLLDALEARFGNRSRFDLLLVNTPSTPDRAGVRHLNFPDHNRDWKGDTEAWGEALSGAVAYRGPVAQGDVATTPSSERRIHA